MSFNFGTPSSAPVTSSTGFSFGTPAAKPASSGFSFSTPAQPQGSGSLFGTPASSTTALGSTSTPAFGTAAPSFGTAAPAFGSTFGTGGLNFGSGATSTAQTGLSFGTPASSQSTGLSFGAPATSSAGLGGFSFTTPATTGQTSLSVGGNLFGATTSAGVGLFAGAPKLGTTTTTSVAPSVGLGGVATSSTGVTGPVNTSADPNKPSELPKQQQLPNEISSTVDTFKEFVKKQKSTSSALMRISIKPLNKVVFDREALFTKTMRCDMSVRGVRSNVKRLREHAAAALTHAERVGTDYESELPPSYIVELLGELEAQCITLKQQIDMAYKQMQAIPKLLTDEELTLGMRRIHESFVALAGRLQSTQSQVEELKELHLQLRRQILKDNNDIFKPNDKLSKFDGLMFDGDGSRKRGLDTDNKSSLHVSAVLLDPRAALVSAQQVAGPTPFTYIDNTFSTLKRAETSGGWSQPLHQSTHNSGIMFNNTFGGVTSEQQNNSFQLQKPPKRGKQ